MTNLITLAERVEAASGPSYALSQAIGDACKMQKRYEHPGSQNPSHRPYSASLDAAMSLIPEGWHVSDLREDWRSERWKCVLAQRPTEKQRAAYDSGLTIGSESEKAEAATPALALTAAALRARASL